MMRKFAFGLAWILAATASAQFRVATWNISNYAGGRGSAIATSVYGSFEGRQMAPDVILGQEFMNEAALAAFATILNAAPGSPGDWSFASYMDNGDSSQVLFYRTSRVSLLNQTTIPGGPRTVSRFDVRFNGYGDVSNSPILALYSSHMKSGTTADDLNARLAEANSIRADANALPSNYHIALGGDFNIQSSTQAAYQAMVGAGSNARGRLHDPINTPGDWNNNVDFRFVHTQDPIGAGGMDDRHDQILLGSSLVDGQGFDYVGNATTPYSTTTWNDPNHSYRAWGNDGTSFNGPLTTTGNQMVGATIAQALRDVTGNSNPDLTGGHLPVFLDLLMPGEIGVSSVLLDFGSVRIGELAELNLDVFNRVDASIWGPNGVRTLLYTLSATDGFFAPAGSFNDAAGGGINSHTISADTSVLGSRTGFLRILDASGVSRSVELKINVVPEPASLAAMLLGIGTLAVRRRRGRTDAD